MSATFDGSAVQDASRASGVPPERLSSMQLRARLHAAARRDGTELAVVDVRETLAFSEAHLIFSTNLALNRLEIEAPLRLPRRNVPIVLIDADGTLVQAASRRLAALGYTHIGILDGGIARWTQDGFPVYAGFNVRSKAFAECVEHQAGTPAIDYTDLQDLPGGAPVILDSRTRAEYHTATVPNAIHAAGADLVRVIRDLVASPETPIVVACGGRTRSIIGAQSLIDAGVPNPVYSLRNGTGGLRLAGHPREHGARHHAPVPSRDARDWAKSAVKHIAADVPVLDGAAIAAWRDDADRTVYLLDLRDPDAADTIGLHGVTAVAGGQLIQELDVHVPVIGARVILIDDEDGIRATMTASWLQRIGGIEVGMASATVIAETHAASGPARSGASVTEQARNEHFRVPSTAQVGANDLASERDACVDDTVVFDLSRSPAFRSAHVAGARWATRDTWHRIWRDDAPGKRVVLTSEDGRLAALAWRDWAVNHANGATEDTPPVRVLHDGNRGWRDAGLPFESISTGSDADRIFPDIWLGPQQRGGDVLPHVRAYLDWEIDLVRQVGHDPDFHALLQLH